MKKNHFFGYLTLQSLKKPMPNGRLSTKSKDPLYDIVATGKSELGSSFNNETNSWEIEVREIDLTFINLSERQLNLLTPPCEILINGGQLITYMRPVVYPTNIVGIFDPDNQNSSIDRNDLIKAIASKLNMPEDKVLPALGALIPTERRVSILRVSPGDWALQASSKQLAVAHKGFNLDDYQ